MHGMSSLNVGEIKGGGSLGLGRNLGLPQHYLTAFKNARENASI